jgi:hypothetical protein
MKKTTFAVAFCLAGAIIWNGWGCGPKCPEICGFPLPTGCTLEFVSYGFFGERKGFRSTQVDSSGCIFPDQMPGGQCPGPNDVRVDGISTSPAPGCFTSFDAWKAQDSNMSHDTGADDGLGDGGWTATAGVDDYGLLLYGPSYGYYSPGNYAAAWKLMISSGFDGSGYLDNTQEVELDVIDVITGQELGYSIITANQWKDMFAFEVFTVPFTVTNNHPVQFRAIWMGNATITVQGCAVAKPR